MFQTQLEALCALIPSKSQSPQVGAMFQTDLGPEYNQNAPGASQSPQVGAMFQTNWTQMLMSGIKAVSIPSSRGNVSDKRWTDLGLDIKSLNPLKSGQCFRQ